MFEDTKYRIRNRLSSTKMNTIQWPKEKGRKDIISFKQALHDRMKNTNPTKNLVWTQMFLQGRSSCWTSELEIKVSADTDISSLYSHLLKFYVCQHRYIVHLYEKQTW